MIRGLVKGQIKIRENENLYLSWNSDPKINGSQSNHSSTLIIFIHINDLNHTNDFI
ncbi:21673_t:CDS:2 [Gigaspora margarita]|uniref:21673_t:CDS:1 n=1 Tax=Gigaspora margarita TaxID=4874 RepID=A0ABN7VC39_GIGMA|nr:21673_t:CDS:2 [Gigaspora margarita]